MKKWKKSGRKRKNKTYLINLSLFPEDYVKINQYRVEHNYSWAKLASVALKSSIKKYKEMR